MRQLCRTCNDEIQAYGQGCHIHELCETLSSHLEIILLKRNNWEILSLHEIYALSQHLRLQIHGDDIITGTEINCSQSGPYHAST